ncbi:MAG TPA: hypothetical protein VEL07_16580 [Planctomycetota bacterium]|nr:hypothetical protein [Planctomycetota bacterium]
MRRLLSLFWGREEPGTALVAGLLAGFIFGVAAVGANERYRIIEVLTFTAGGKVPAMAKPMTPPPPGKRWVQVLTTGYCACEICCAGSADGLTAINRKVSEYPFGYAVADFGILPKKYPLEIPGYGYAEVDDTGGDMRKNAKQGVVHLDLRHRDHQVARQWGRRLIWLALPEDSGAARLAAQADQARGAQ